MNELTKYIYKSGYFDSVLKKYLKETFNELIELNFKDHERDVLLNENPMDFFYSISCAIQELSIEILNENFNEDDNYILVDHIKSIQRYISSNKYLFNDLN